MDDQADPILNFFSEEAASDPEALYKALHLDKSASPEETRKAYRKLALKYHPDKHASKGEKEKQEMGKEFQKIGFAYAVLSDEARKKRYDSTGRTAENSFTDAQDMGWDAYFESLFQRIDRKLLDDDKAIYQGSKTELEDLAQAYLAASGSLPNILSRIPHASYEDEARLIAHVEKLISDGELEVTKQWTKTSKDEKASKSRKNKAAKEAKEAEQAAKELGVWDEFYGNGEKGKRCSTDGGKKNKGKGKAEEGEDALAAIILRRQKDREGGLDAMAEKYKRMEDEAREKKRAKKSGKEKVVEEQENEQPGGGYDISDADFEALQAKMFSGKEGKGSKSKKSRA